MQWHDDRATRTVYSTDNSIYQLLPERVGLPGDASEIAAALRTNFASPEPRSVVARGGGTGTNGQSLTSGLVLDLKRTMHELVSLDVEARTVTVQPGIVTAQLNARLAQHGLFWPPHTSTLNRATVGGMISTDAAGKGSLVYGRAHRHVERLVMVLDDGTEWIAEPVAVTEAERRAAQGGRGGELWRSILDLALDIGDATDLGLPELARGFSGYGIDRLRVGDMIDPLALVCGAEGTLGIVTEATLSLSRLPTNTRLVVASYATFCDALDDAVVLRATEPIAIECFDETTLERGRSSPAWTALGNAIGDHQGAVLLLEYDGDSAPDLDPVIAALDATGRSHAHKIIDAAVDQQRVWKVRADAVGLVAKVAVGGPERSARPTAFVEDCAVSVEQMASFISAFRRILDDAGLTYAMFGHADVGCVHVRPALDLTDPVHRDLVLVVTEQVTALVREHGGLVWGEHGRGFRGAHVDEMLPSTTVALMRQVKSAFDPNDIFNPGKLYRPIDSVERLLEVDEPPMRGQFDAEVAVSVRRDFGDAFACNGNGLCHHYAVDEVMCPSYKATGDPALSPRGRVDLLRSWLREGTGTGARDDAFEDVIADNLHQCLSCSACTGHCPVEVDIPELKSRFLDDYYRRHRRPLSHVLLGRFEQLAAVAARAPVVAKLGRKPAGRLLGLVDLPVPVRAATGNPVFVADGGFDVVVIPDVFTSILEPQTVAASLAVLEAVGYRPAVAPFVPSGKFDHVKGRRARFTLAVERQRALVDEVVAIGAVPVVIEPAVALLHSHEYPAVDPTYPHAAVRSLAQVLLARADRLHTEGDRPRVRLLGHCTERATSPRTAHAWVELLEAVGFVVEAPPVGCCGMAGIFGHERANQAMSRELWDLSWAPHIARAEVDGCELVATGYSCRSQAKRFAATELRHPVSLLARR